MSQCTEYRRPQGEPAKCVITIANETLEESAEKKDAAVALDAVNYGEHDEKIVTDSHRFSGNCLVFPTKRFQRDLSTLFFLSSFIVRHCRRFAI